ncbi:MAG: hypothetical protein IID28_04400 [Planctomycetes bacterium]|nr:hypothetical protein [Planctomycetota bacterium]
MRALWLLILVVAVPVGLAGQPHQADPAGPGDPVEVFADLDGSWQGVFVGYDAAGRELYRIRVRQTYRTIDRFRQVVEITDTMADGTVITGHGTNTARRVAGGGLRLRCVVEKSNGEKVEHDGRVVRGPDGDEQIIWYSSKPGRVETFRERVHRDGDEMVYEINGMGRYGETLILMSGRYRKIANTNP